MVRFLYELASRNWVNAFENTELKLAELAEGLAQMNSRPTQDEAFCRSIARTTGKIQPSQKGLRKPVLAAAAIGQPWLPRRRCLATTPAAPRWTVEAAGHHLDPN